MKGVARGRLDGETVVVEAEAEANRLYNKGFVGTPQAGNTLRLSLVEAAHAVANDRLVVDGHDVPGLLAVGAASGERVEVEHLAYGDLRDRGLVVRHDGDGFAVWRRGEAPPAAAWFRFHAVSERQAARPEHLLAWAQEQAVVGVVDEDGSVTYYALEPADPQGEVPRRDLPALDAEVLDDRVLVKGDEARMLQGEGIGTPHPAGAIVSFTEAESLRRRGVLRVPDLTGPASARQHHFPRTFPVYEALRAAGVVAKSGFRFGTHLRGYRSKPDEGHAEWLIHCCDPDDVLHWSELSRGVRLAHGVRKSFLVAVATEPVAFVALSWFRP